MRYRIKFEKFLSWRRKYSKSVNLIAILVVFATTYALILPALTLDQNKVDQSPGISLETDSTEAPQVVSQAPETTQEPVFPTTSEEVNSPSVNSSVTEVPTPVVTEAPTPTPTTEETTVEAKDLITEQTTLTHKGSGYELRADFDGSAKFHKGIELQVRELDKNSSEHKVHYDKAKESLKTSELSYARFFDITFVYQGKEVEPAAPVRITIKNDQAVQLNEDSKLKVVHFEDTNTVEVIKADTVGQNNQVSEVAFKAESFSIYGDVAVDYYTVDFVYIDNNGTESIISSLIDKTPGSTIANLPAPPFKNGYVFSYWQNKDTKEKVDENTVVTGNMTIEAVFVPINIYTIDVSYYYRNNSKNQDVIIDKETVQLEASDTPYQIVPPSSTQVSSQEDTSLPTDAIYYPERAIIELTADNLKALDLADGVEDRKITQKIKYIPFNAEYDVYYMLKNLTGTGYSQIQVVKSRGVLGSTVTPQILSYNYADYEKSDTTEISQVSGQRLNVYYTRRTFNLIYNSNGGSNIPQQSGLYESQQTVNPTVPTKIGYDFAGWYDNPQLSGSPVSSTLSLKGDTTLYAKWTPKTVPYTIVYYKQEYDNVNKTTRYVYDSLQIATGQVGSTVQASTAPNIDTNSKYWEKDTTENTKSSVEIAPDGSSVLKVYYRLKPYTFVFDVSGPTSMNTGRIRINNATYNLNTYTIPNVVLGQDISSLWPSSSTEVYDGARVYNFNYWKESSAKTKRFEVTSDLLDLADTNNTIKQTAVWTPSTTLAYVEYWLQSPDNPNLYVKSDKYSQSFIRTDGLTAKSLFGYTYLQNYTPTGYQSSQTSRNPFTYRFYYDRTNYTIYYYYNGSEISTTGQTVPFEKNINSPTYNYTPSRPTTVDADYTWGGWYADAGLTTPYNFSTMPRSNLLLYAKWIAPKFKVIFDGNGATSSPIPTQSIDKYKYATAPADPIKEHYNFLGWYTEDGKLFSWSDRITKDVKLTARWELKPLSYKVQYLEAGTTNKLAADKVITSPALMLNQSITELPLGITGYRPDSTSQTIQLDYENNVVTFYYSPKATEVTYTVHYVLKDNPSIHVAPSRIYTVDGSIVRAKESAASVDKNFMKTQTGVTETMLGKDYYPTVNTFGLVLTSVSANNIITFEYVAYDTKIFTVNYLDMDGNKIEGQEPLITYQQKPGTFVLNRKAIDGYTYDHSKDSESGTNKVIYKFDSGGQVTIDLYYKKNLTITATDKTKVYDGKTLTSSGLTDIDGSYQTSLKLGDTLTGISYTGSQTDVGRSTTTPKDAVITNALGANRTNYYNVVYKPATLEVTPQPVVVYIEGEHKEKTYDGQAETIGYTIKKIEDTSGLFKDSLIVFNGSDADKTLSKKDAGDYILNLQNRFSVIDPNYNVVFHVTDGNLKILPRQLIVSSDSAEKNYDGSELRADKITVSVPAGSSYSGFVSGEGIVPKFASGPIDPGVMSNIFTYAPNNQTNLTNYEIETKYGKLKIFEVINIQKTDLSWNGLNGGKFELAKWDGINWSQVSGAQSFDITSANGSLIPVGLEAGRYRLQELAAPDGFIVLDSYIYFTVNEKFNEDGLSSYYTVSLSDGAGNDAKPERAQLSTTTGKFSHQIQVANEQGKALPSTGGSGQKWFIISGIFLMIASYLTQIFIKTRRKGGH